MMSVGLYWKQHIFIFHAGFLCVCVDYIDLENFNVRVLRAKASNVFSRTNTRTESNVFPELSHDILLSFYCCGPSINFCFLHIIATNNNSYRFHVVIFCLPTDIIALPFQDIRKLIFIE